MNRKSGIPVVVTGFGPFGNHKINISWEVAKVLSSLNFESHGIDLIIKEVPVVYAIVSKEIPSLWKKFKPKLVIHMGVTSIGSEMTLETIAHKNGYIKVDVLGKLPENGSAIGEKDVLCTGLNVQDVCDHINNSAELDVPIHISSNAGRYLCEFTYYTSLNIDYSKTIFIHIPDFDKGYTALQIALIVKHIILLYFEQIKKSLVKTVSTEESISNIS